MPPDFRCLAILFHRPLSPKQFSSNTKIFRHVQSIFFKFHKAKLKVGHPKIWNLFFSTWDTNVALPSPSIGNAKCDTFLCHQKSYPQGQNRVKVP